MAEDIEAWLARAAAVIGASAKISRDEAAVSGSHADVAVRCFTKGGRALVSATLPAPVTELELYIIPTDAASSLEAGAMVDVVIGEPAFDAAFHVQGAPSDVVRRVVTLDLRVLLQRHAPCSLRLVRGAELQLAIGEVARLELETAVPVIARCAAAMPDLARAAVIARDGATAGVGYRPGPDAARVAAHHRLATLELAYLRDDERRTDRMITTWMAAGAVSYVVAVFALLPIGYALLALFGLPLTTLISMIGYAVTGAALQAIGIGPALRRRRLAPIERQLAAARRELAPGPPAP